MPSDTIGLHRFAAVDPAKVGALIQRFATISEDPTDPGITRLGYTALERQAHSDFHTHMRAIGLETRTDAAGNSIAELAGTDTDLPAIGTGSHLDSVPNGGRFDGIAGVVAAMEVARMFVEESVRPRHSLRFVAFACEEGARFGQACVGSRIISGLTSAADLEDLKDRHGTTAADAMRQLGIDPSGVGQAAWSPAEMAAFIELHIEQGGVLADSETPIGIVDVISGSTRMAIDLTGRASHTGGTPMHHRADALAAAAGIVLAAEELANSADHRGTRITVGKLDIEPGSITTIPGYCRVYVDVRDVDAQRQRDAANDILAVAHSIARSRGVGISSELLADTSPVTLPIHLQSAIVTAARQLDLRYRILPSGASHDTQMINRVCPGGMIFVPSLNDGVSHAPAELTSLGELSRGIDLLAMSLLVLDESEN